MNTTWDMDTASGLFTFTEDMAAVQEWTTLSN